jgi:outer membrane protein TolC
MRYFFLAALVPAALSAQPSQEAARPISLAEAVQLAQQNSPQTISARNTINANEATVRTRWSAFLPTLSGNVSSSWGAGQVFDNKGDIVSRNNVTPWNWSRRISANWLVFDGGDRNFQLRAARANVDAAEANAVATEFSVAYTVSQQFYAALAARERQDRQRRRHPVGFLARSHLGGQSATRRHDGGKRLAERECGADTTRWHAVHRDRSRIRHRTRSSRRG